MNEFLEIFSVMGVGGDVVLGSGVGVVVGALVLKKLFGGKKKKSTGKNNNNGAGGYGYGDVTTSGYDTKAGNYVDELNSDSVLTQDVQDFAIPSFSKDELETTTTRSSYRKKTFNASLPGMTLGDTRPMVPLADAVSDYELQTELRSNPTTKAKFGLRPKAAGAVNMATITSSGLKILDDTEQLMRPASPEKYAPDAKIESVNIPISMKAGGLDPELVAAFEESKKEESMELNFGNIPELKMPEVEIKEEPVEESYVPAGLNLNIPKMPSFETEQVLPENFKAPRELSLVDEPVPSSSGLNFVEDLPAAPEMKFFTMDVATEVEKREEAPDEMDLSDIPGLNLDAADEAAKMVEHMPTTAVEEDSVEDEYFTTIVSRLDESEYPETVVYHQEIEKALVLDNEDMKEQALQTLNDTVEFIKNVKVKFYFKLAIQSYVNKDTPKALPDIIKNFYDFEYEKYSKK